MDRSFTIDIIQISNICEIRRSKDGILISHTSPKTQMIEKVLLESDIKKLEWYLEKLQSDFKLKKYDGLIDDTSWDNLNEILGPQEATDIGYDYKYLSDAISLISNGLNDYHILLNSIIAALRKKENIVQLNCQGLALELRINDDYPIAHKLTRDEYAPNRVYTSFEFEQYSNLIKEISPHKSAYDILVKQNPHLHPDRFESFNKRYGAWLREKGIKILKTKEDKSPKNGSKLPKKQK